MTLFRLLFPKNMNPEINFDKLTQFLYSIIRKVAIPAGLYIFLLFIVSAALYFFGFAGLLGSPEAFLQITDPKELEALFLDNSIEILILNTMITIVLNFFMSGIYGMILESTYNPFFGIGSALKIVFSKRGLKVLLFIIVLQTIITALNYFFALIDLRMVGFAIGVLLQFLTCFTLPAIYVDDKGILKSIGFSTSIVNSKPAFYFIILLMAYLLSLSGILFFGIGIIFTLPLSYFTIFCLYLAAKGQFKD